MIRTRSDMGYEFPTGNGHLFRILSSAGVSKAYDSTSASAMTAQSPLDGDIYRFEVLCAGTETIINLRMKKTTTSGKVDLYVNNSLDTSGIDLYGSSAEYMKVITLTIPIAIGVNIIELRVNGKNGSSSNYYCQTYGIILTQ